MSKEKRILYGGQAVVEGVMFGGQRAQVTAIRRQSGEIETLEIAQKSNPTWVSWLKKIPLLRGFVSLIEASATGAKHLQFSTDKYEEDEGGKTKTRNSGRLTMILGVAVVGVLSFLFGKILFTATPAFLASFLFDHYVQNLILQNLIEGAIKTLLLLGYLWLIAKTPMIKRLFQYHGAEHKVINAYENGEELSVPNVQKQSTLHYRCGSSFIIFTVLVGVIIYSFFPYETVWDRVFTRILLIPVITGVAYEVLRFTNAMRGIPFLHYLGYPGLWLQHLTTRQPTDDQVEVAIASFLRMRDLDQQQPNTSQMSHASLPS